MVKPAPDQKRAHQKDLKRQQPETEQEERPQKRIKALLEDDSASDVEGSASSEGGGVLVRDEALSPNGHGFTVNEEYARRFEHNKEREELQRLEEKYPGRRPGTKAGNKDSESSTDSEEEDDDGFLASEALDAQIQHTLEAIRRKDPDVYDEKVTFYTELDEEISDAVKATTKKEKPMFISDYHRKNLLDEATDTTIVLDDERTSYAQQQDNLKNVILKEMHAAAKGDQSAGDEEHSDQESVDEFLVRKTFKKTQDDASHPKLARKIHAKDVETAGNDPETFLSKFMSARAWVPSDGARFEPFESDDEDEDRRAEMFEEAYNMRFENPKTSNEKLLSHARDAAAKYSLRKEDMNPRRKAREVERAKKDVAKQLREEEIARLRKLKVAEVEEKIRKIKDAAGLRGKMLQEEDWSAFLEEGWDDGQWEKEMKKRFGQDYYADNDVDESNEEGRGKRKVKKPKWEDEIDIGDLVPDFDEGEDKKQHFSLTDDESFVGGAAAQGSVDDVLGDRIPSKPPKSKERSNRKRDREEENKKARQERRKIEHLVDERLKVDTTLSNFSKKHTGHFRYRETSPTAYGLTAQDILMASDSQLNQYAGLKKMAAFRDSDKKRKDKKRLGKKARLRQWRKETFGSEQGTQKTLADLLAGQNLAEDEANVEIASGIDINNDERKASRSRKSKAS